MGGGDMKFNGQRHVWWDFGELGFSGGLVWRSG